MINPIFQIAEYLDTRHTYFAVSRLIMLSGVQLRRYKADSPDDQAALRRVAQALRQVLTAEELATMTAALSFLK